MPSDIGTVIGFATLLTPRISEVYQLRRKFDRVTSCAEHDGQYSLALGPCCSTRRRPGAPPGTQNYPTNQSRDFPYSTANCFSSTTSNRRSPDSHFEIKGWGCPSLLATWTWVSPASKRACRRRFKNCL